MGGRDGDRERERERERERNMLPPTVILGQRGCQLMAHNNYNVHKKKHIQTVG